MNSKVFFISFTLSAVWIVLTDNLAYLLFPESLQSDVQHIKGIFYALSSNLVLSWYVQREVRLITHVNRPLINRTIFLVSSIYSVLWIIVSDRLVYAHFLEDSLTIQTAKGLIYVFTWSLLVSWFAQREIRLNQQLFPLLKSSHVGRFASLLIHEVRNPMSMIQYCATQIPESSGKEVKIKQGLIRSIESLDSTIQFLYKISRDELLEHKDISEKIYIAELIDEVSQKVLKEDSRINFLNKIAKSFVLRGSYGLLSHLFSHLFNNAVETLNDVHQSQLEISASAVIRDDKMIIRFENSGQRLMRRRVENLFTAESSDGESGFGLIICRKIAEAHRGSLDFDKDSSHPAFLLTLPLNESVKTVQE